MAKKGEGRNVRFEPAMLEAIEKAAKEGGFASPSSFIRQAVVNQLQKDGYYKIGLISEDLS